MIRLFFSVCAGAFILMAAGMAIVPSLVLGAYQAEVVSAWEEAGVDTSSCKGSVPSLGIGVRECYEGSIRSIAEQIRDNEEERTRYDPDGD